MCDTEQTRFVCRVIVQKCYMTLLPIIEICYLKRALTYQI